MLMCADLCRFTAIYADLYWFMLIYDSLLIHLIVTCFGVDVDA